MKTLADIREQGLIARLQSLVRVPSAVLHGIGDDAAAYDLGADRAVLVTVDTMVAGEHFLPDSAPMRLIGRKAMSSSVSDIVAMNGQPLCAVVALSAPKDTEIQTIEALYQGLEAAAQDYSVALVGGDTTRSSVLAISVTVIGEAHRKAIVPRSGAMPGDVLCVTGTLGASQAGLQWLLSGRLTDRPEAEAALRAHYDPTARIDIVRDWQRRGVRPHALTDISDGLAAEVHNLCDASKCGAVLDAAALPVSSTAKAVAALLGEDALDYALHWGEDYELLFALPDQQLARLHASAFTAIGRCTAKSEGVRVKGRSGRITPLARRGWEHF